MPFVFVLVLGAGRVQRRHQTARVRLGALPAPLRLRSLRRRHVALADADLEGVAWTRDRTTTVPSDCQLRNAAASLRRRYLRARQLIFGNGDLQLGLVTIAVTVFVLLLLLVLLVLLMLLLLLVLVLFMLLVFLFLLLFLLVLVAVLAAHLTQ